MAKKISRGTGILFLFILIGLVVGSLLTKLIGASAPILTRSISLLNLPPSNLNLGNIEIVFGISLSISLIGVLGIVIGIMLYKLI